MSQTIIANWIYKSTRLWNIYAKLSPIIFLVVSSALFYAGLASMEILLCAGAAILITTMIIWWFWMVWSIGTLAHMFMMSEKDFDDIKTLIRDARQDIKHLQ